VLLWLTLRRLGDMLRTIVPLLVAGVVTLELCVAIGLQLNFANIIALPLLLGIGVAFKIYYVMAWRGGQSQVLQSPLTRAVFFSALTTATAFGSLWFSNHPGTSSMGKLLALSLVCTLAAAVLFQPALMGPPRVKAGHRPLPDEQLPAPRTVHRRHRVGSVERDPEPGARLISHRVQSEQRHAHARFEPLGQILERHINPVLQSSPLLTHELGQRTATVLDPRTPTQSRLHDRPPPVGMARGRPILDR